MAWGEYLANAGKTRIEDFQNRKNYPTLLLFNGAAKSHLTEKDRIFWCRPQTLRPMT